jgi:hypothetical protein
MVCLNEEEKIMRKNTILSCFLFSCALLLVCQIPGALAQTAPDNNCTMSGSHWLLVCMDFLGPMAPPQLTPQEISDGLLDPDPNQSGYCAYFHATLDNGDLAVIGNGVFPSVIWTQDTMHYALTQKDETISIISPEQYVGQTQISGFLTKTKGAPGFNHLEVEMINPIDVKSASAELVDKNGDGLYDSLEGLVKYVSTPDLLFDSSLGGSMDQFGRKYVVIPGEINIGGATIPGPKLRISRPSGPWFGDPQVVKAIYIPLNDDYSLDLQCGSAKFGPVLRKAGFHAVPTFSGLGLMFFCGGVFVLGIWAMRKARFGNTLASL